ncbi:MAG: hypothetical protein DMD51_10070 [Gemmatimonadetes bacterium]|nr:MAG: hypothetical protein DMD51_10070 [Gemmatimonadota bacterium]
MHLAVLFALLQHPAAPAAFPVSRVEITPPAAEIEIGQTVRLAARALDVHGQPVTGAAIAWYSGGTEGDVDSTGLVKGGYNGYVRVTAVAYIPGQQGQVFGDAVIHVLPEPAARIDVAPAPAKAIAGTRLTLAGAAYSKHGDRRADLVSFSSSNPRVASVTADGRLHALAPGRVTITAKAGPATTQLPLQVVASTVTRLAVEPASSAVRTGDVIRFTVNAKDTRGRAIADVPVEWAVAASGEGSAAVAQIDATGAFVAETPGVYTVTASLGGRSADAVVRVEQRRVTRGIDVLAHLPIKYRTAEAWVHPSGKCLYMTTIADRVYAIDIADPASPKIVDSMLTDARLVNDVMTTEDGKYGVFSREGASNRKNGIVVFDANDACHPKPVAEYTETVSGGVHSSYVYQGRAYITDDATGSMRVIDIRDATHPKEVARVRRIPSSCRSSSMTSTPPTPAWNNCGERVSCGARIRRGALGSTSSWATRCMPRAHIRASRAAITSRSAGSTSWTSPTSNAPGKSPGTSRRTAASTMSGSWATRCTSAITREARACSTSRAS